MKKKIIVITGLISAVSILTTGIVRIKNKKISKKYNDIMQYISDAGLTYRVEEYKLVDRLNDILVKLENTKKLSELNMLFDMVKELEEEVDELDNYDDYDPDYEIDNTPEKGIDEYDDEKYLLTKIDENEIDNTPEKGIVE